MAVNLQTIIQDLKQKTINLTSRYEALSKEKENADKLIGELRNEVAELKKELEAIRTDNQFLILSHRLASGPDMLVKSRRTISRLIRDIDKCISQLKE